MRFILPAAGGRARSGENGEKPAKKRTNHLNLFAFAEKDNTNIDISITNPGCLTACLGGMSNLPKGFSKKYPIGIVKYQTDYPINSKTIQPKKGKYGIWLKKLFWI